VNFVLKILYRDYFFYALAFFSKEKFLMLSPQSRCPLFTTSVKKNEVSLSRFLQLGLKKKKNGPYFINPN